MNLFTWWIGNVTMCVNYGEKSMENEPKMQRSWRYMELKNLAHLLITKGTSRIHSWRLMFEKGNWKNSWWDEEQLQRLGEMWIGGKMFRSWTNSSRTCNVLYTMDRAAQNHITPYTCNKDNIKRGCSLPSFWVRKILELGCNVRRHTAGSIVQIYGPYGIHWSVLTKLWAAHEILVIFMKELVI